ncbi:MAG: ADP-ribosylglycohydrolase family protein [Dehalococcoidia bacterium]|nr:MAG: ADP-ribosylglycohydrolase family protein [Dehalococcoidia bacterium]
MVSFEGNFLSRFQGCLVGLGVGDALGAPVEGMSRTEIAHRYGQVTEMLGGGWHGLQPGGYTDDTAMMLCIARGVVEKGRFDPQDVTERFIRWFNAGPIGIGRTTWIALSEIKRGASWKEAGRIAHDRLGGMSAGNGSIMRCAPIGLLHFKNPANLIEDSIDSSIITHWDPQACWGAVAVNMAIAEILKGDRGNLISTLIVNIEQAEVMQAVAEIPRLNSINREPSAYVLDTLQAALWCFLTSSSFESALVAAVNLGGDTDTVGAVCGALAGASYGFESIPERWHEHLQDRDEILSLAQKIYELVV